MTALQAGAKTIEAMVASMSVASMSVASMSVASMSVASAGVAMAISWEWQAEVLAVRWSGTEESPRRYFADILPRIDICGFFWLAVALMEKGASSAVV
jgi:hypothetical protein